MSIDPERIAEGDEDLRARAPTRAQPGAASAPTDEPAAEDAAAAAASRELSEEVPVPIAMWPSEIDERARVVEAIEDENDESGARRPDDELNR
jgi:hypothetical protein